MHSRSESFRRALHVVGRLGFGLVMREQTLSSFPCFCNRNSLSWMPLCFSTTVGVLLIFLPTGAYNVTLEAVSGLEEAEGLEAVNGLEASLYLERTGERGGGDIDTT